MNNNYKKFLGLFEKKILLNQLSEMKNKVILDFGITNFFLANLLDSSNYIISAFTKKETRPKTKNNVKIIEANISTLKKFKDEIFDFVFCDNILDYLEDETRKKLIIELTRVLKKNSHLSIIKSNKFGLILSELVSKNNLSNYKNIYIENEIKDNFGNISFIKDKDISSWSNNRLTLINKFGINAFLHLYKLENILNDKNLQNKILESELFFSKNSEFINISLFHHLVFIKK